MTLQARLAKARQAADPAGFSEVRRITSLPIVQTMTLEELEAMSRAEVQAEYFDKGFRLWPIQCEAINTFDADGSLFAPVGCGHGKSNISLICIDHAIRRQGVQRALLLVPKHGLAQMVDRDIPNARKIFGFSPTVHVLGNRTKPVRLAMAKSRRDGLYVMPYSLLSCQDTDDLLEGIAPGLIVSDEAHHLRNLKGGARTKRLMRYLEEKRPMFVALSGTMTSKSLKDYYHLIKACLRQKMPLPMIQSTMNDWAAVLDASPSTIATLEQRRSVIPLTEWAKDSISKSLISPDIVKENGAPGFTISGLRRSYRLRLVTTQGVVATGDTEIGVSLVMSNKPVPNFEQSPGWSAVADHLYALTPQGGWLTPSGDEIEHAIHTYKWAFELSAGFFNELVWPSPEDLAQRRRISVDESTELLAKARQHHGAKQEYAKELRDFLQRTHTPGLDTPLLVAAEMARSGSARLPGGLYQLWMDMKALEFPGMPERDSRAVRVCPFKIDHAVQWAKNEVPADEGALLWVENIEIGKWLYEVALRELGGPDRVLYCPAGPVGDALILDPGSVSKIIVASLAHSESKNLQAFRNQFFVQWPRGAHDAEQALARLHRPGQTADELIVNTCHTLDFDHKNFAACLNDAMFIHHTDHKQRLIYANYETRPQIYPPDFLLEQGFQNRKLDEVQIKMMEDVFGAGAST